ncbi:ABC transporter permease [Rubripirellula obstinata]|uniref:ABC transporter permease n=1 Tax=Rubripirellula obstinata TaxID=406547 RepID=UPI00138FF57C|nr:hypothetical protein [Rubripirellula obstinata]
MTIATVIGIPTAWACTVLRESNRRMRTIANLAVAILGIVAFVPLVLHGAAWEATAGKFGLTMLTQTGTSTSASGNYVFFSGMIATAWIHGVYGSSIVALATLYGVERMPRSLIDQSRLDAGPVERWWKIRLPVAKPWCVIGMMAVAGIAVTEMTIADLYGYRTIADQFYLNYALRPTVSAIAWTTVLPLILALMLIFHWSGSSSGRVFQNESRRESVSSSENENYHPLVRVSALSILLAAILVAAVVPITGLITNLGREVIQADGQFTATWSIRLVLERVTVAPTVFASEYQWTAMIAAVTSLTSVAIAWPLASLGRRRDRVGRLIDFATIAMVCVPGPIVGLAVVTLFQADVPGFPFLYQQTILPTTISMLMRGIPVSYWIIRSGYRAIASQTLDLARLDASPVRQFWSIERPLVFRSLIAAALVSAVVTSGDLPVSLPVIPAGVTTVPVRLFGLLHSGARYQEAALVFWYVLAIVFVFGLLRLVYTTKTD